jgi:hypothetical protein
MFKRAKHIVSTDEPQTHATWILYKYLWKFILFYSSTFLELMKHGHEALLICLSQ